MPTLNWIGKESVVNHHRHVPYRLLHCDKMSSAGDPDSGNLLVHGDNLEALKALLPYYVTKVKCIYIDPPYNTGNEKWVYNDNVNSPQIRKWLGKVVGQEAEDLTRHDKWLCMMYPRLALLREFLSSDGAIFVSIDDHEFHALRLLMDEVFGPNAFVCVFVWRRRSGSMDAVGNVSEDHEYVVCYAGRETTLAGEQRTFERYSNPDEDARGPWIADNLSAGKPGGDTLYEIEDPTTGYKYWPPKGRYWPYSPGTMNEKIAQGRVIFPGRPEGSPLLKRFKNEARSTTRPVSTWIAPASGKKDLFSGAQELTTSLNSEATKLIKSLFGDKAFNYSKPIDLVTSLIGQGIGTDSTSLILDSFAGSGTTGHAVLQMNKADGGNRKFICIEMDETIARDVTAQRLRKVVEGYTNAKGDAVEPLGGGFRFCTLGKPLFDEYGSIDPDVKYNDLAAHVFFSETGSPLPRQRGGRQSSAAASTGNEDGGRGLPPSNSGRSPLLGTFEGRAVYLLFNGILGDKKPNGGNVLTGVILESLPAHDGPKVIYGEACRLGESRLRAANVTFKQMPWEVRVG